MTQPRAEVIASVACPSCGAKQGQMCMKGGGFVRERLHQVRIEAHLDITTRVATGSIVVDPDDDMPLIEDWP